MANRKEVVIKTNESNCHLVISHKPNADGYVEKRINGVKHRLHRYIYEQHHGKIPQGQVVRHKCDNPNCINIEHLELGSDADNVKDRVERNRSAKGVNNGRAKLNDNDVRAIRESQKSIGELAKDYKVDPKTIRKILNFQSWKHVS